MYVFNAFQLVLSFACAPFVIQWVKDATFYAHGAVFWVLIVAYLIGFGAMIVAVTEQLERK